MPGAFGGTSGTGTGGNTGGAHGQTTWMRWDPSTAGATIVVISFAILLGLHVAFRTDVAVKF